MINLINFFRNFLEKKHHPIKYILVTGGFSVFASYLFLATVDLIIPLNKPKVIDTPDITSKLFIFLLIVPLVENLILSFGIEFLLFFLKKRWIIISLIGFLSGLIHFLVADWRAVSGAILFSVMTASYLIFYEEPFLKRFFINFGQHVLFNSIGFSLYILGW